MKKLFGVLLLSLSITACAGTVPLNVIMTNPNTGQSVYIHHYWWGSGFNGLSAMIEAQNQQEKSIKAARMMGYTEMKVVE